MSVGDPSICNCALIVAHPDDETIFGGRTLLHSPPNSFWHVVVLTNARNKKRVKELLRAMSHFPQVKAVTMLNMVDNMLFKALPFLWKRFGSIEERIHEFIQNKKLVVSHNERGEYGHIQHRGTHKLISNMESIHPYTKFKYFQFETHLPIEPHLKDALQEYKSQRKSIKNHSEFIHRSVAIK